MTPAGFASTEVSPDPLGTVANSVGSAVAGGLSLITLTVLGIRLLAPARPGAAIDLGGPFFLLMAGTLGGVVLAFVIAWWLLGPVGSTYRRGAFSVISGFATILAMLVCMPVDRLFGPPGLLALVTGSAVAAILLARRARRLPQGSGPG